MLRKDFYVKAKQEDYLLPNVKRLPAKGKQEDVFL